MAYQKRRRSAAGKKTSEGGRSNPQKASPVAIESYLKGVHYPTNKNELVKCAKQNHAPNDVMHVIEKMPEKKYASPIDISKEVGKME